MNVKVKKFRIIKYKTAIKPALKINEDRGSLNSVNDQAKIYDFEGGLYPADSMDLAVLLNSD